ncbi:Potassium transporter 9 [Abeliophyllum distichum]|uniref:Potassium transporter 9 n=1 Tax=Abeliophyllum distichum TaxID=126358 RepID=A0ABD1UQR6_9LAMI
MEDNNAKDDVEKSGGFGGENGCFSLCTEQVEEAISDVERTMSITRTYQQPPRRKVEEYPAVQTLLLAYQSLGVVYGDLGTSPVNSDEDMTYYSRGSSLRTRTRKFLETSPTAQNFLTILVLLGTCMVIGDGALTPATCVLSALQGIQSRSSKITQDHVVWISVVLLIALFAFQHCGTSKVGFSFSPIMLLWFVSNVSIGTYNIIKYHPSILKAVSPHYIVKFFSRNTKTAWDLLGAVFLSITGAEAMFADLGHFNKRAIQLGFSFVVYPALILTYAGETAYLVKHPEKISDAYYSSLPDPVYWPMFVISTLAAVVASQSMISASFSIVKQSLALGCFPRVNIIHTSSQHEGQVYSPEINYILMILTVGLVVGFKGGVELANAYGKATSG